MDASEIEDILRESPAQPPFPPASDRAAWEQARAALGARQAREFIGRAEAAAREPIPALPASLWLECLRTGRREGYEQPCYRRRTMLRDLVIGEGLERQGRFTDALMDVIWAICEESSWVYPAHLDGLPEVERPYIDLGAASTGFLLALAGSLVSRELPPEVGERIRSEVDRRLLAPFLARNDFWWLREQPGRPVNNWTAVCCAGVMAAALYLEDDLARLAAVLVKGLAALAEYLATFDEDGGTTEGPGYWSYGFGYYTLIAYLIEQRSGGKISLMASEQIQKIAAFPLRTMLSQGLYVNFSDAPRQATFIGAMLAYLGRRFDLPGLIELARDPANRAFDGLNADLEWVLPGLFWDLPPSGRASWKPGLRDWYRGMMWMIARSDPSDPDGLVLAAKGGHNDEMHNQNDVGSFIVQVRQEALIADPGAGHYTRQYFGEERYEHFAASALGHSVPVPNGQIQQAGRAYAARLLEHRAGEDQDMLRLELSGAYPAEADLASLERRLALHRVRAGGEEWVELEDRYEFNQAPGNFESALITFARVEVERGAVVLAGERGRLRIGYPVDAAGVRVETISQVDLDDGPVDIRRVVVYTLTPQQSGSLRLVIKPVSSPGPEQA